MCLVSWKTREGLTLLFCPSVVFLHRILMLLAEHKSNFIVLFREMQKPQTQILKHIWKKAILFSLLSLFNYYY